MSAVKSGGSSSNGRESHSKRLGAKLGDGQFTLAGGIIYRQRGTKIHPGNNAGRGNDDTIFALIDGYVKYEKRRNRTYASVYAEKPTHSKQTTKTTAKAAPAKTAAKATAKPAAKKATTAKPAAKATAAKKPAAKKATTAKPAAKATAAKKPAAKKATAK